VSSRKIIFLTIAEPGYSRSWTYFIGIKKLGANVEFIRVNPKRVIREFMRLKQYITKDAVLVVMSPSQYLVPFARLFLGKRIILDAGWSLFEGTVISRNRYGFLGVTAFKNYFIDFISSHIAHKILLESKNQGKFYRRLFLVRSKKIAVIYTGVNEEAFSDVSIKAPAPIFFENQNVVLFRGKYNVESGIKVLAEATKLLSAEEITFWVYCPGLPKDIEFSENTYVNREHIKSQSVIAGIYNYAQITIGQLSTHSRLKRTLPHKAFESAYLSKPYISLGGLGIKEIFLENFEFICLESPTAVELADKIKSSIIQPESIKKIGRNMKIKYESAVSQEILSQRFIELVADLK
jgi:hypothetical protein